MAALNRTAAPPGKIHRVLIVDDSPSMCAFLSEVIDADPQLTVVGTANDPYEARDMIKSLNPDVLTLDVEMPRMDGLTFLRNLMRLRPMPVVMISSLTSAGASTSLEALSIGAVDFMVKREIRTHDQLAAYNLSIRDLVKGAAGASMAPSSPRTVSASNNPDKMEWARKLRSARKVNGSIDKVLMIGASTGGPEAIKHVLENLSLPRTAAVIAQHMPARFIEAFAERLNKHSRYTVRASRDGELIQAGHCYVASGDAHTAVVNASGGLCCRLVSGDKVNGHMPSVDSLFHSAAQTLGGGALGVLLTGMGNDGAAGLAAMRRAGSLTIAQDEHTSAVWGMPGSAVKLEGADAVLPLQQIGPTLTELL